MAAIVQDPVERGQALIVHFVPLALRGPPCARRTPQSSVYGAPFPLAARCSRTWTTSAKAGLSGCSEASCR